MTRIMGLLLPKVVFFVNDSKSSRNEPVVVGSVLRTHLSSRPVLSSVLGVGPNALQLKLQSEEKLDWLIYNHFTFSPVFHSPEIQAWGFSGGDGHSMQLR